MDDWIDAESRVERARELYEEGRWAEAAAELRAAIDVNPGNSTWYFNLGLTLEAMSDFPRAREAYEQALQLDPEDVETLNCLGVNLTRLGKYAESLKCFQQIEKLKPDYEPAYCNRIVTYCEIGRHEDAELMFYLARLFKDECPLCYYNIGTSLQARDDMDRAIYCWEKALELDPQQPQTHARLAEAWWTLGDLDKARMHYEAEMALGSEDANLLLDFGEMLLEMDEVTEAETRFREALEASPQNVSAHFGLGEVSLKRGKAEEALERFRLVLKLDPAMQGGHAKMARALVKLGKVNEAAKHVVIELRQSGADPQMLQELGELLIEAQLSRHASKVLSRLVELRPDDPYAHHNLAVSYFMMGRYDDGITHCQKALKLKADYPLATYNLALAYMQKGDRDRARQYAVRALEMAPEDTHIVDLARELGTTGWLGRIRGKLSRWSRKGQPRHAG